MFSPLLQRSISAAWQKHRVVEHWHGCAISFCRCIDLCSSSCWGMCIMGRIMTLMQENLCAANWSSPVLWTDIKIIVVAGFDIGLAYICSFISLWCFIVFKLGDLKLSLCVKPVSGLVLIGTFFLLGSNICSKLSFITRPLDWHKNAHCDRPWHWTFLHLFLILLSEWIWCCIVFRLGGLKLSVCVTVLLAWFW